MVRVQSQKREAGSGVRRRGAAWVSDCSTAAPVVFVGGSREAKSHPRGLQDFACSVWRCKVITQFAHRGPIRVMSYRSANGRNAPNSCRTAP